MQRPPFRRRSVAQFHHFPVLLFAFNKCPQTDKTHRIVPRSYLQVTIKIMSGSEIRKVMQAQTGKFGVLVLWFIAVFVVPMIFLIPSVGNIIPPADLVMIL